MANKAKGVFRGFSAVVLAGVLGLSAKAYAGEVTHVTLDVENVLGIPPIQAQISACLGEQVFLTGTVRITMVDGVATHFNWGGMTGETADGDRFVGGSGVSVGIQSNLTLVEVSAGKDSRQVRLQSLQGEPLVVDCH